VCAERAEVADPLTVPAADRLLVVAWVALAVSTLAVPVGAWSLVARFRRAGGVERQQLRWLALAAALLAAAALGILVLLVAGIEAPLGWIYGACLALLPVATGAAILRYRLYDLDQIITRTLAYGLLTVLLGLGYGGLVLVGGQVFGGGRYDAARTIEAFSARLRQEVDLDPLTADLLAVVDRTVQPARSTLWLRPPDPSAPTVAAASRQRS
jgi:hypothetical protein